MTWEESYELARKYYEEHKNLIVPFTYKVNGCNLGRWLSKNRTLYKQGKLSVEQIKNLDLLEMIWDLQENKWNKAFKYCEEYYKKYGNLSVNREYITEDGFDLGIWILNQRVAYTTGKLSIERIRLLESIDMVWDVFSDKWETGYNEAKLYYEENGDLFVQINYITKSGYNLGAWITYNRKKYKDGLLTEEQIKLLNGIGMNWDAYSSLWNKGYESAKTFFVENKHLFIPRSYKTNCNFELGNWISTQRIYYRNKKLTEEQIGLLESIGMVWSISKDNKSKEELCLEKNISYDKNKKILNHITYNEFKAKIYFLEEKELNIVDNNGILVSAFYMSNENFKEIFGIDVEKVVSKIMKNKCKIKQ